MSAQSTAHQPHANLRAVLEQDGQVSTAMSTYVASREKVARLKTQHTSYITQAEEAKRTLAQLERRRLEMLEGGEDPGAVEAQILQARTQQESLGGWSEELAKTLIPRAEACLKSSETALANALRAAIAGHQESVKERLRALLVEVLKAADGWREAKKAVLEDLGLEQELAAQCLPEGVYLTELVPDKVLAFRSANGPSRPWLSF